MKDGFALFDGKRIQPPYLGSGVETELKWMVYANKNTAFE